MNSYLIINVKNKNISNFIKKCIQNNIDILRIKYISHNEIIIKIYSKDYEKLLKKRSIYIINIISSSGFLKIRELVNINKIFIISFSVGIIFLYVLSNIIFSIDILNDNKNINRELLKDLNSYGIKKYNFKKKYIKIKKIKNNILNDNKDKIEWIEITDVGTKYQIKYVERRNNKIPDSEKYTDIVAKKPGIIKKIYAENGQKQLEINNYVNKGDIIISGTIMKGEDIKDYVHAKGKVYAEIWYDVKVEFPLKYTEKNYTNNNKKSIYIKLNNKYIEFKKYKNYVRKNNRKLKNYLIPFEIGIETQKEVIIINDKYTINEAKKRAIKTAENKILQNLDKDEYIIDQKLLNFKEKNSKIELDMFFTCLEEIGKEEEIYLKDK